MKVEINEAYVPDSEREGIINKKLMITPVIGADGYWVFKVQLSGEQAIIAFKKFGTLGIGFLKEDDWNTNLPYSCSAEDIYNHIKHNKGNDDNIREDCVAAIEAIQAACKEYMGN